MTQKFTTTPTGSIIKFGPQLKVRIPDNFDDSLTWQYGPVEPTYKLPGMVWADSANGLIKMLDSAGTTWLTLGPIPSATSNVGSIRESRLITTLAATNYRLASVKKGTVVKIVLWSNTTTVGSSGSQYWRFQIRNVTQALNLFSTAAGTDAVVSGVGGGEITVDVPYVLTANQNANVNENDLLRLEVTSAGTPTAISELLVGLDYYQRG